MPNRPGRWPLVDQAELTFDVHGRTGRRSAWAPNERPAANRSWRYVESPVRPCPIRPCRLCHVTLPEPLAPFAGHQPATEHRLEHHQVDQACQKTRHASGALSTCLVSRMDRLTAVQSSAVLEDVADSDPSFEEPQWIAADVEAPPGARRASRRAARTVPASGITSKSSGRVRDLQVAGTSTPLGIVATFQLFAHRMTCVEIVLRRKARCACLGTNGRTRRGIRGSW